MGEVSVKEESLRKLCAEKAISYIKDNTIIGLGAGRNIACLIELIAMHNNLKIKVVTPSINTKKLCLKHGIEVLETCFVSEIAVAFDGCGEVDENFYASKGGGGVFTKEKIIASMAKEYILLIDEHKLTKTLSSEFPVSLEVIKASLGHVYKKVNALGGVPEVRVSNNTDGYVVTDDGNFLIDVKFKDISDFNKLNFQLKNITGVVETSIFTKEVTKLIVASENGVKIISKL